MKKIVTVETPISLEQAHRRRIRKGVGLALLLTAALAASAIFYSLYPRSAVVGTANQNLLVRGKQLSIACLSYAQEHDGWFPVHLRELEPTYIPTDTFKTTYYAVTHPGTRKAETFEWLYFGSGFRFDPNSSESPTVLLAAPLTTGPVHNLRVFILSDSSGTVGKETDYQERLAATIRQMKAREEKRRGVPPDPTSPPVAPTLQ